MGRPLRNICASTALLIVAACTDQSSVPTEPPGGGVPSTKTAFSGPPEVLVNAIIHRTVEAAAAARAGGPFGASTASNLSYRGGLAGIGVETRPLIYLVLWGSQWSNGANDPSGEVGILQTYIGNVGGSAWLNSVTQYCQGVASGTVFCSGSGTPAGNQTGMLAGVWFDGASAAPTHPKQSQFATEAIKAATHFGNTTTASNASAQYVIATSTKHNAPGFGSQYCAYHSYKSSSTVGNVAYTNLPYITDAGGSCGANFNGLGPLAGITIVEGHELAETISDQFPSKGWLDSGGAENGDKCAWSSASDNATFGSFSFPVQPLWSNASSSCVMSF
jgi:hypothetical protein